MKKQNGYSNNLLLKNKTKSKEVSPWNFKEIGWASKQKRTLVKRRRIFEIYAFLDRQISINDECVVLPPKTDEKEPKRRRGRPNKSKRKQSIINKTSTTMTCEERVDPGVHQSAESKQNSLVKSRSKEVPDRPQLQQLLTLLPQPQEQHPWREMSPPFMNLGSCSTNYKGKEVVIYDETHNVFDDGGISSEEDEFTVDVIKEFNGAKHNLGTTTKSSSSLWIKGSATTLLLSQLPPQMRDDMEVRIQEVKAQLQQPLQPIAKGGSLSSAVLPVPPESPLQECAESLYGKEFFLKREPQVVGVHTAMMVIAQNPNCHDALKALMNTTQSPLPSVAKSMITTTLTHNHQFLSPPPAFTASDQDIINR